MRTSNSIIQLLELGSNVTCFPVSGKRKERGERIGFLEEKPMSLKQWFH
jgi:hypothetical protein